MIKKGNFFDQAGNGWVYGHFISEGLAHDDRMEMKVVRLNHDFTSEPHYNKTATKLDIVWEGAAIWNVDGEDLEMKKGDYLIIPPKVTVYIKEVLSESLTVQTIKIPSVPDDKVIV